MPATSPTADTQLVANLRANVRRLRDELDVERARGDDLANALLNALPPDPQPDHQHNHLLGDPSVCCLMAAHRMDSPGRRRALDALGAWQAARTGQGVVIAAYEPDPEAKFVGRIHRKDVG